MSEQLPPRSKRDWASLLRVDSPIDSGFRVPNPDYRPDANLRWDAARIPVQHRGHTLEDLPDLPAGVLDTARQFVASFRTRFLPENTPLSQYPADRSLIGVGMTLMGMPGHGKTSLACAILTEVATAYPSTSVMFAPLADYIHAFNERHTLARRGDPDAEARLQETQVAITQVFYTDLVVLDDVGHEHSTASRASSDEFERIVRSRYRRGLPTLVTTNLMPQEWAHAYSPAMADFLFDALPPLVIDTGISLRKKGEGHAARRHLEP